MMGIGGLGLIGSYMGRPLNNNYLASPQQTQSTEMIIPNELIGCIIGRGGAKINEIRYVCASFTHLLFIRLHCYTQWL